MESLQIIVPHLSGGGAEDVARRWALGLSAAGFDVQVVLTHEAAGDVALAGVSIHSLSRVRGFLNLIRAYRSHLIHTRPSAVLSVMPFSNLVLLLAVALIPRQARPRTIISEHTLHSRLRKRFDRNFRVQLRLAEIMYRTADACVAVSHAVGAEICALHKVPTDRLWIVPNPVLDRASTVNPHRGRVSELSTVSIVVPARLVEAKRPQMAMIAARLVMLETGKATVVHYFGSGPMKDELVELSRVLDVSVVFHGWVENWFENIPRDGVVVLPSAVEGFGNVLIEAASKSVPSVVASRTLGAADACLHGITGVLTASDGPSDYAKGVINAANLEIGDIEAWLERFTIGAAIEQLRLAIEPRSSG